MSTESKPSSITPAQLLKVTPEAVQWAYRLILGREPSPEEISAHLHAPDLARLRQAFFGCREFRERERILCGPSLSGFESPLVLEDDIAAQTLEKLLAHIQASWQELGQVEPYWSVLSSEEFKLDHLADNREQFYASGNESVEQFLRFLERNGCFPDGIADKTVLEYGCGVGRATHALARHFSHVYAYDISASHLSLAKQWTDSLALTNITFTQIQRLQDVLHLPKVQAVYTIIVLQHNPPPVIRIILRGLLSALLPGGVALFQLTTYRENYSFAVADYLRGSAKRVGQIEMHVLPQRRVFEIIAQTGCQVLEVLDDAWAGYRGGELSNTFLVRKHETDA
ncbi:MAG: methyltransferase domain-containing protein [Acidobacteriota bacterium]